MRRKCTFFALFFLSIVFNIGMFQSLKAYPPNNEVKFYGSEKIKNVCTGLKKDQKDPRWSDYALKMVFTHSESEDLGVIVIVIWDIMEKRVFRGQCDSPWFLIDLEPGTYYYSAYDLEGESAEGYITLVPEEQTEQRVKLSLP